MRGKTSTTATRTVTPARASMRPPHECGGKHAVKVRDEANRTASMRPPHECGGKRACARRAEAAACASMRPPHECGGKLAVDAASHHRRYGFNEAPARMRGKTREVRRFEPLGEEASMRPPHECGGKLRGVELCVEPVLLASMRPPHECGGKPRQAVLTLAKLALQ